MSTKYNTKTMSTQECIDSMLASQDFFFITGFFEELTKNDDIYKLQKIHSEVKDHMVKVMTDAQPMIKRMQEEAEELRYEEDKKKGTFELGHWKRLQEDGLLKHGDLVEIDIEVWTNPELYSRGRRPVNFIQRHWQDTFLKNKHSHIGSVFFEGENMYIERGDKAPLRIFPYLDKRFGFFNGVKQHTKLRIINSVEEEG